MNQKPGSKQYDLEERTFRFAKRVISYVNSLPRTIGNIEVGRQLVRAAGSVGANYREANESLSKKDFTYRCKICRKESKESIYWLRLSEPNQNLLHEKKALIQEGTELMRIFGAIVTKCK
jgi:four helix bundle protein